MDSLQPIEEIVRSCRLYGLFDLLIHTVALQPMGKVPANVLRLGIDFLTICSPKFHGPEDVDALCISQGIKLESILYNAQYEQGLRPETKNVSAMQILNRILSNLLRYCCSSRTVVEKEDGRTMATDAQSKTSCLSLLLEFEVGDYVLDLTYTQTLCWHGLLFCPFLPLIGAIKNILIFAVKLLSLTLFRNRAGLELSPARARYIFTAVLLFSFVWALLPIAFLTTSLRPSRGCSPFRLYSHEPDFYMYYSIRNVFLQIQNKILVNFLIKLTSAVVIVPLILILILFSCVLIIQRNSYRGASVELYKLLYTSHKTHQLAVRNMPVITTTL